MYGVWADNDTENGNPELGSAGGPYEQADWWLSGAEAPITPGYFENVEQGAWTFDDVSPGFLEDSVQVYNAFEWRFKLASSAEASYGIMELWVDGMNQGDYRQIRRFFDALKRGGISTIRKPSKYNFSSCSTTCRIGPMIGAGRTLMALFSLTMW